MGFTREKDEIEIQPAEEIILGTRSGGNVLVTGKEGQASKTGEQAGGRLYTEDMPAIEDLLARYEVVTAVIHKPAPVVAPERQMLEDAAQGREESQAKSTVDRPAHGASLAFGPVLVLGGLPAATFAAGLVILLGALFGGAAVANAYLGLLLFFGGLGLGVVARIALDEEADA